MVAALPPVVEAVKQALLIPPPAMQMEFEAPETSAMVAGFEAHEDAVAKLSRMGRAHVQQLKAGIDLLEVRDDATLADVEKLIELAEQAVAVNTDMVAEGRATRDRVLKLPFPSGMKPRVRRLMNRLMDVALDFHNGFVDQTMRLKAIAAALDPDSKVIVATSSTPDDVKAFFASLRAS